MTYLSQAPEGLSACYVTGGLPALEPSAAEVYRRTYPRVQAKNKAFYRRYPQNVAHVARIADRLSEGDVRLPDGDVLTVRRFQSLGIDLGMKPGHERLHWLLDEAFTEASDGTSGQASDRQELSATFLHQVLARTSYTTTHCSRRSRRASTGTAPAPPPGRLRASGPGIRSSPRTPDPCCSPAR